MSAPAAFTSSARSAAGVGHTASVPRTWRFGQCFGEKDSDEGYAEVDMLSAVRFDETGDYLATGDKGGRVVIFERNDSGKSRKRALSMATHESIMHDADTTPATSMVGGAVGEAPSEYKFFTEFQSHEPEFDYLKSMEIEEKINQIAWCKRVNNSLNMLTTNDKTIKLWRVHERQPKFVTSMNVTTGRHGGVVPVHSLRVPSITAGEAQVVSTARRVYANAHAYHINSIAVNSDGQTFLSADDLRINLWSLDNAKLSFNVVDIKPPSLEELTEVITAADFHPSHCHVFMYSSSRGTIRLGDMRDSALCDKHSKAFEEAEDPASRTYFSEVIASVSDIEFTRDGRYIIARDYLSIKVWDIAMESRPVRVIPVHEYLRPKLVELYESDCIFDKFELSASGSGTSIMTGSYSNTFKIYDVNNGIETSIELTRANTVPPVTRPIVGGYGTNARDFAAGSASTRDMSSFDAADPAGASHMDDFTKKVLHYSWHPTDDIVAVAGLNNLYIYHA